MQKKKLIANYINKEWVKALQPTITAMNNETTRLTGLKPAEAILLDLVPLKSRQIAPEVDILPDRKSTRLNSSHLVISYAVFCLKKKKTIPCTYMLASN